MITYDRKILSVHQYPTLSPENISNSTFDLRIYTFAMLLQDLMKEFPFLWTCSLHTIKESVSLVSYLVSYF